MTLVADVRFKRGDFDLDVQLELEGVTVLMGPNGAGKTTFLKLLIGALTPQEGRILSEGRLLFDAARGIDRPPEERRLAYVPSGFGLFPHMSALDNVVFGIREGSPEDRRGQALDLLDELDAIGLADRKPAALSAGEQQRVALARAIATDPELILLDEPLSALDPTARPRVRAFLSRWLYSAGVSSVVVTHDAADAREFADRLVILEKGRIVQVGSPDEVAFRPASTFAGNLTAALIERDPRSVLPPSMVSEDEE